MPREQVASVRHGLPIGVQIWIGGLGVLRAATPPTVNLGGGGDCGYDEAHDIGAS
jgi:hypothetical protein